MREYIRCLLILTLTSSLLGDPSQASSLRVSTAEDSSQSIIQSPKRATLFCQEALVNASVIDPLQSIIPRLGSRVKALFAAFYPGRQAETVYERTFKITKDPHDLPFVAPGISSIVSNDLHKYLQGPGMIRFGVYTDLVFDDLVYDDDPTKSCHTIWVDGFPLIHPIRYAVESIALRYERDPEFQGGTVRVVLRRLEHGGVEIEIDTNGVGMNAKTLRSLFVIPLDVKPEGSWAVVPVISEGPSLIQSLDAVRAGAEFEIVNRADPDALPETVLMNSTMLQGYHATPLIAKKVFRWTTGTSFRIRVKDSRTPFWKSPINRWMMSASLKGLALDVLFAGKLQRVGTSLYRARLESLSLDDPFDVLERGISLDIAMQKARDYEQLHGGNLSLLLSRAKDLNPLFRERLVTGDPPNFALVVRQENGKKKVYVVALDLSHQWPDSTEDYRRRIQLATLEAINAGFPLALDYDSVASIIPDIRQLGNYKESPMSLIARITPKLFEVWMSKESGPVLQILARSS